MSVKTLPYESLHEIFYHTWLIKAGHHTFVYTGTHEGLLKAKARIEKEHPPAYTVKAKKVA